MKTSNKLLIGFSGILVLFMLCSAIILRVDYARGITNTHNGNEQPEKPVQATPLKAFKVLVLTNRQQPPSKDADGNFNPDGFNISIGHANDYTFICRDTFDLQQSGDTLYISAAKRVNINLNCPSLEAILSNGFDIYLQDLTTPRLKIQAGAGATTDFSQSAITAVNYTGGLNSTFRLQPESKIDSLAINLGKGSALILDNSLYKAADIVADSLSDFHIAGRPQHNKIQIR
ncbi:hypothetical protein [Chitinophaga sp. 212800010-3]|uniref:hypothetical protein n=1 Tax=unclassified Chitinophaga TaxID=2619133 RepID=UPI002DF062A4|nr:hypothetical protein [Chitinophaga sp. 212800010-3]